MLEAEVIVHRHHVHTWFSRTRTQHDNSTDIGMDSSNLPQVRISVQDFIHQSVLYGGIAEHSCRVVFLVVLGTVINLALGNAIRRGIL